MSLKWCGDVEKETLTVSEEKMKRVELPILNKFTSSVINLCDPDTKKKLASGQKVSFTTPDFGKGGSELETARDNGAQVVYATITIENKLDEILALYFFGVRQDSNERRSFFVNQVLQSSRFDFVFKRELMCN